MSVTPVDSLVVEPIEPVGPSEPDSLELQLRIDVRSNIGEVRLGHLDIFVYELSGLRELVHYGRYPGTDKLTIKLGADCSEDLLVAIVANAPGSFVVDALKHFDSLRNVEMDFGLDSPVYPIMTSVEEAYGLECRAVLEPVMSRVLVASVTNYLDMILGEDILAEYPSVRLIDINSRVRIFSSEAFPSTNPFDSDWVYLPYDIGVYTQYPHIELFCYPNDLVGLGSATNPETQLEFCCSYIYQGVLQPYSKTIPLGPLERNSTMLLDINIR